MFPVDYWKRIISVDIIGLLQWIYCRGFISNDKHCICEIYFLYREVFNTLKAFLIHLCCFVHLSEE